MKYPNISDFEAAKRLILEEFVDNTGKNPKEVEVYIRNLLTETKNKISGISLMALVNALCKDRN